MVIEKAGMVVVSEEETLVTGFTFAGDGAPGTMVGAQMLALAWALGRLQASINELQEVDND